MATATIVQQDWARVEARAFTLFLQYSKLDRDDALLAALAENRNYEMTHRALLLVEKFGASFKRAVQVLNGKTRQATGVLDVGFLDNEWVVSDVAGDRTYNQRSYTDFADVLAAHDACAIIIADEHTRARLKAARPASTKIHGTEYYAGR